MFISCIIIKINRRIMILIVFFSIVFLTNAVGEQSEKNNESHSPFQLQYSKNLDLNKTSRKPNKKKNDPESIQKMPLSSFEPQNLSQIIGEDQIRQISLQLNLSSIKQSTKIKGLFLLSFFKLDYETHQKFQDLAQIIKELLFKIKYFIQKLIKDPAFFPKPAQFFQLAYWNSKKLVLLTSDMKKINIYVQSIQDIIFKQSFQITIKQMFVLLCQLESLLSILRTIYLRMYSLDTYQSEKKFNTKYWDYCYNHNKMLLRKYVKKLRENKKLHHQAQKKPGTKIINSFTQQQYRSFLKFSTQLKKKNTIRMRKYRIRKSNKVSNKQSLSVSQQREEQQQIISSQNEQTSSFGNKRSLQFVHSASDTMSASFCQSQNYQQHISLQQINSLRQKLNYSTMQKIKSNQSLFLIPSFNISQQTLQLLQSLLEEIQLERLKVTQFGYQITKIQFSQERLQNILATVYWLCKMLFLLKADIRHISCVLLRQLSQVHNPETQKIKKVVEGLQQKLRQLQDKLALLRRIVFLKFSIQDVFSKDYPLTKYWDLCRLHNDRELIAAKKRFNSKNIPIFKKSLILDLSLLKTISQHQYKRLMLQKVELRKILKHQKKLYKKTQSRPKEYSQRRQNSQNHQQNSQSQEDQLLQTLLSNSPPQKQQTSKQKNKGPKICQQNCEQQQIKQSHFIQQDPIKDNEQMRFHKHSKSSVTSTAEQTQISVANDSFLGLQNQASVVIQDSSNKNDQNYFDPQNIYIRRKNVNKTSPSMPQQRKQYSVQKQSQQQQNFGNFSHIDGYKIVQAILVSNIRYLLQMKTVISSFLMRLNQISADCQKASNSQKMVKAIYNIQTHCQKQIHSLAQQLQRIESKDVRNKIASDQKMERIMTPLIWWIEQIIQRRTYLTMKKQQFHKKLISLSSEHSKIVQTSFTTQQKMQQLKTQTKKKKSSQNDDQNDAN